MSLVTSIIAAVLRVIFIIVGFPDIRSLELSMPLDATWPQLTPSSTVPIGHRTVVMVRRCKKYCYKSSRYLQSRVPQFDSGFRLQFL